MSPRSALAGIALLLSGCTATPERVVPSASAAMLRLMHAGKGYSHVHLFDTWCERPTEVIALKRILPLPSARVPSSMLGAPASGADAMSERQVPAGKPLRMVLRGYSGSHECSAGLEFNPLISRQYEVVFEFDGIACRVRLNELRAQADGSVQREPVGDMKRAPIC